MNRVEPVEDWSWIMPGTWLLYSAFTGMQYRSPLMVDEGVLQIAAQRAVHKGGQGGVYLITGQTDLAADVLQPRLAWSLISSSLMMQRSISPTRLVRGSIWSK